MRGELIFHGITTHFSQTYPQVWWITVNTFLTNFFDNAFEGLFPVHQKVKQKKFHLRHV